MGAAALGGALASGCTALAILMGSAIESFALECLGAKTSRSTGAASGCCKQFSLDYRLSLTLVAALSPCVHLLHGPPITVFASYLAVIAGLVITLLLLALARKALPALPVSIALGVLFYFLTRLVMEPVMVPLSLNLGYY